MLRTLRSNLFGALFSSALPSSSSILPSLVSSSSSSSSSFSSALIQRLMFVRSLRTRRARTSVEQLESVETAPSKEENTEEENLQYQIEQHQQQTLLEQEQQQVPSAEALKHYYEISGTIFSSNPSQSPTMKKIWQSSIQARAPIAEFQRFEDMLANRELHIVRSMDSPPQFGSRDVLPVHKIVHLLLNSYAEDIVVLEQDKSTRNYADYVVIATGKSGRHLYAMGMNIKSEAKAKLQRPLRISEMSLHHTDKWAIVTSKHVVVHLFLKSARESMDLESIWTPQQFVEPPKKKQQQPPQQQQQQPQQQQSQQQQPQQQQPPQQQQQPKQQQQQPQQQPDQQQQ